MRWPWQRKTKRPEKIGLALSGGSVRGAAHLGVLEVLEREGIRPQCVAGASAGSLVGALYCAGISVEEMKSRGRETRWTQLGRITRPRLGFFDISRLESYVDDLIERRTFDQLPVPFAAVAVDILRGEVVVLREGSVARAVRASCALPGAFTPLEDGDRLLVDGGLLNNLPVSVVREMGADYVIAVDLSSMVGEHRRPKNIVEMWGLTFNMLVSLTHSEAELADCLIRPNLVGFNLVDFSQTEALIEEGRAAAEAALPRLRKDLTLEAD